ncbi:polymer-forming cytoskeletal protein [Butyrivibrio sp. WCD3002]|uniref:polymer-forming cytoskeletal protein n=1 Tax=Butyrivibrio sp. WCD3002 TaxID=1280676 RepID=UPI00041DFE61|nr:polymer-forming cytoskeletal protein [Butyrivibrio sp. WCD3002]
MGFFSELKSDLSQAAKTIIPEDNGDAQILKPQTKEETASTVKSEAEVKKDLNAMLDHLDEIELGDNGADKKADDEPVVSEDVKTVEETVEEKVEEVEDSSIADVIPEVSKETASDAEVVADLTESLSSVVETEKEEELPVREEVKYEAPTNTIRNNGGFETMDIQQQTPTDETASITEGMKVVGNLETTGSLELVGKITGNVICLGKLNVTGEIEGDSKAAEIYAEAARITGEVRSQGSVKIGQSTVVIGNIFATSAVIAGAVKGDIDVPGPVVLDTTAIVMGNIKSQSVQINNGAVIEGNCSQAYAEVNPSAFFDGLKGTK